MLSEEDKISRVLIGCAISAGLGALQYRTQLREGVDWEGVADAGKGLLKVGKKAVKKVFKGAMEKVGDIADVVKDTIS